MGLLLRPATMRDREDLLRWRNEPVTVANSNGQTVTPDEHAEWLAGSLRLPSRRIWIVTLNGRPIGQLRLDREPDGTLEMSVGLEPGSRGQGHGTGAIRAGLEQADAPVVANVRAFNIPSRRAFTAAGFTLTSADEQWCVFRAER